MGPTRVITGLFLLSALAATPALADDGHHRRGEADRRQDERVVRQAAPGPVARERAVPRYNAVPPRSAVRQDYRWNQPQSTYVVRRPTVIAPRVISPRIVTVVPYRPYVYRPSLGLGGVYYGYNGAYPYGYTPRGYYDPLPGVAYGGVRITGAPRDAQVFADGYYVGIVDDFDGVFQHVNLQAGPHHIEVQEPGLQPIAFDVMVQPGQTITFRADMTPY
jgi:hypothetical protein